MNPVWLKQNENHRDISVYKLRSPVLKSKAKETWCLFILVTRVHVGIVTYWPSVNSDVKLLISQRPLQFSQYSQD